MQSHARPRSSRSAAFGLAGALVLSLAVQGGVAVSAPLDAVVSATIPLSWNPGLLAANPATNEIYVAITSGSVAIIDGASDSVAASVGVGELPLGVAVNSRTNRAYIANVFSNTATVIDGATRTRIADVAVGFQPRTLTINEATNRIYVANRNPVNGTVGTVSVIDGSTDTLETTYGVPRRPEGIAINPVTNRLYISDAAGTLSVMNAGTGVMVAVIPVGGPIPSAVPYFLVGVAVNPTTNRIYVANMATNQLVVIDGATNSVVARVPVGAQPQGVAVNPATNRIYVANMGSDTLSIIDGSTNTPADTAAVGQLPMGVAVNPSTNRIYVANAYSHTVSVLVEADTTAPDIAAAVSPSPNQNGWNNSDVTLAWTVSDAGSGIASTSGCATTTLTDETAGTTLTCTAENGVGLSTSTSVTVRIDGTAPTIHAVATAPNSFGWNNTDVQVTFQCADALSDIDTCSSPLTLASEGRDQSASGHAIDLAGNTTTVTVDGINIDKTAPEIAFSGNALDYLVDETIRIDCAVSDALAGVATSICPNVDAAAYAVGLGEHTLVASATDKAGNVASAIASFTVSVTYDSLCRLTRSFATDAHIADVLCSHLTRAAEAAMSGPRAQRDAALSAYSALVRAQTGNALSAPHAETLLSLVEELR